MFDNFFPSEVGLWVQSVLNYIFLIDQSLLSYTEFSGK